MVSVATKHPVEILSKSSGSVYINNGEITLKGKFTIEEIEAILTLAKLGESYDAINF